MHEYTMYQLKNLIDFSEQAIHNKEKVYTIKEFHDGVWIDVMTDRAGFLENVLIKIQGTLIDEVVQEEKKE